MLFLELCKQPTCVSYLEEKEEKEAKTTGERVERRPRRPKVAKARPARLARQRLAARARKVQPLSRLKSMTPNVAQLGLKDIGRHRAESMTESSILFWGQQKWNECINKSIVIVFFNSNHICNHCVSDIDPVSMAFGNSMMIRGMDPAAPWQQHLGRRQFAICTEPMASKPMNCLIGFKASCKTWTYTFTSDFTSKLFWKTNSWDAWKCEKGSDRMSKRHFETEYPGAEWRGRLPARYRENSREVSGAVFGKIAPKLPRGCGKVLREVEGSRQILLGCFP